MVLEIADFLIKDGDEARFEAAYGTAVSFITTSPGCRGARLVRGVENPSRFVLLVEWDTIEDHTTRFRGSPAFEQWRAAVGPYFAAPPTVEHTTPVSC